jgi:glutamyl-tRNA synthetase
LHHGLLLGEDGAKLSKRTGSHSVADLRQAGLFPEALQQAMVRLGHPNISDEATTVEALTEATDIEHLSTSSVRWSNEDMWRWHSKILHHKPSAELAPLLTETLKKHDVDMDESQALVLAELMAGNLNKVEDVLQFKRLFNALEPLNEEDLNHLKATGDDFFQHAINTWRVLNEPDWKAWASALKEASGNKGKALFLPLRLALTGQPHGPEMSKVVLFLGKEGVLARLQHVLDTIE